ncbi:glutamate-rich protein 2-like isoform X2 [Sphaeramia orbicularis]|uniref:glutamate-rich protein 2-like isoform X2 n=1 Tax=Sphaeramia orbicularis TaxID=375764 RepID=UPI00117DCE5C|nr:glutamate-rich protein 2-like isoform X2 [Sphaeramia orbicularis]
MSSDEPSGVVDKKTATDDAWNVQDAVTPHSVKDSYEDTKSSGSMNKEVLHADASPSEPLPTHEEEPNEEEHDEDEDVRAPVVLITKFLRALQDRHYHHATHLCQMILAYEPNNPEASEFLPLIHKKILEEQEEQNENDDDDDSEEDDDNDEDDVDTEDDEDDTEDDDESESDDESDSDDESSEFLSCLSSSSAFTSSSSLTDDDDDDEEKENPADC